MLGSFTKAQLDAAISDGNAVYVNDTPALIGTNFTGTAAGLTAGAATTATNQSGGTVNAVGGINRNGTLLVSDTAPTMLSTAFGGTGAAITNTNGSAVIVLQTGTSPTAVSATITMPAAPNGWVCKANYTGSQPADRAILVTASSPTAITVACIQVSTGTVVAFTGFVYVFITCLPY
ncbi:MAG: hypothetical protein WC236_15805 [Gallionellaceae bacterium]